MHVTFTNVELIQHIYLYIYFYFTFSYFFTVHHVCMFFLQNYCVLPVNRRRLSLISKPTTIGIVIGNVAIPTPTVAVNNDKPKATVSVFVMVRVNGSGPNIGSLVCTKPLAAHISFPPLPFPCRGSL